MTFQNISTMKNVLLLASILTLFAHSASAQPTRQERDYKRMEQYTRPQEKPYSERSSQPAYKSTYQSPSSSGSSSSSSSSRSSSYQSYGGGSQMSEAEAAGIMALFMPWVHYEYAPKKNVRLRIFQLSFIAGTTSFDRQAAFGKSDNETMKLDKYGIELGYMHQITPFGLMVTGNFGLQSYGEKEQTNYFRQAYVWRAGLAQWIPVTTGHLNGITLGAQAGKGYFRTNGVEGREAHTVAKAELSFVTPSLKTWRIAYGGTYLNEKYGWSRDLEFGVTFSLPVEKKIKIVRKTEADSDTDSE